MARPTAGRSRVVVRRNHFPNIVAQIDGLAREAVGQAMAELKTHMVVAMAEAKSGRVYVRRTRIHQAAAEGEAPAMDTGALANSIAYEFTGRTRGVVFTNQEYGPHLEFGTVDMGPRPFMTPAADEVGPRFVRAVRGLGRRLR